MSVLFEVPLIRQEAFTTCWFAAGRMVKAYGLTSTEAQQRYLQQTSNLQRFERVYTSAEDKSWMYAKVMQGKRFAKGGQTTRAEHNTFIPSDQRAMARHAATSSTQPPGEGLHFYFDGELDRYLSVEGLAKVTESSSDFLRQLANTSADDAFTRFKDKFFLEAQFNRLEKELRARGPLMVSLTLPASGVSHAHVITGVLKTPPDHAYENRFDAGEFTDYGPRGQSVKPTPTRAPHGYWVFLNDPSGSAYQIKELDFASRNSPEARERRDLTAERYPVSLSQLMLQMLIDYDANKMFTEPEKSREGQTCNMVMVYAPANAKVQRQLPLPDECNDKGFRFPFF